MTSALNKDKGENVKLFTGIMRSSKVPTLEQLFETYMHMKKLKPGTKGGYINSFKLVRDWMHKPINQISKDDVVERMIDVTRKRGPGSANKLFRTLRAVYNFAINYYENSDGKPLLTYNPVHKLSDLKLWNKLERRQSIILKHQFPIWLRGVFGIEFPATRDMVLFLWLTGSRVGEARLLKWQDVDLDDGFVTFKATKNGKDCTLPVCQFLWDLLRHRYEIRKKDNDFVFPSNIDGKPLSNNYTAYRKMCKRLGFHWKFHDLRRSFITRACALGLSDLVIKRLVNHSQANNVTAGYAVLDPNDLRAAVELITTEFLRLADYDHKRFEKGMSRKYSPYAQPAIGQNADLGGLSVTVAVPVSQKECRTTANSKGGLLND